MPATIQPTRTGVLAHTIRGSNAFADNVRALTLDAAGRVLMGGWSASGFQPSTLYRFAFARYTGDGDLDLSFNSVGTLAVPFTALSASYDDSVCHGVVVQSDGKIVGVGPVGNISSQRFSYGLVRMSAAGALDATFGTGGLAVADDSVNDDYARACALQSDGKIIVVGTRKVSGEYRQWLIQRWNTNGTIDSGFGTSGHATPDLGVTAGALVGSTAHAVAVQGDGKIVVAGHCYFSGVNEFVVIRLNTDGSLDSGFGSGGVARLAVGTDSQACAMLIQPDGKIVLAGYSLSTTYRAMIARFTTAGAVESAFGTGTGYSLLPIGTEATGIGQSYGTSVVRQSDGGLVVVGYSPWSAFAAKVDSNGDPVTTGFGAQNGQTAGVSFLRRPSGIGFEGIFTGSQDYPIAAVVHADDAITWGGYVRASALTEPGFPPDGNNAWFNTICSLGRMTSAGEPDFQWGGQHPVYSGQRILTQGDPTSITGVLKGASGTIVPAVSNTDYAAATHASRHQSDGADAIKLDDLATPDDNTDLNVSTSRHGLAPKISGSDGDVLTKSGTAAIWATPAGGASDHGGLSGLSDDDHSQYPLLAGRSGGQSIAGDTASAGNLTLRGTAHATAGHVIIVTSTDSKGLAFGGATNDDPLLTKSGTVEGAPALALFTATIGGWATLKARGFYFGPNNVVLLSAANTVSVLDSTASAFRDMKARKFILSAPTTYTASNVTTDRSFDANSTTLDEVADVLGTLIDDLRTAGIVL